MTSWESWVLATEGIKKGSTKASMMRIPVVPEYHETNIMTFGFAPCNLNFSYRMCIKCAYVNLSQLNFVAQLDDF